MTWEIFLGIVALFGFGVAVISPIIKLNNTITKLNCSIDALNEKMARSEKKSEDLGERVSRLESEVNCLNSILKE